jgi:hypothetical protein
MSIWRSFSNVWGESLRKRVATIVNTVFVASGVWAGYRSMAPANLLGAEMEWVVSPLMLVSMPLIVLGMVQYSISVGKQTVLRRPAWDRFSLYWPRDPLQCLLSVTLGIFAMVVGSGLRLFGTSSAGLWTFLGELSTLCGLLLGQYLVYRVHHERITAD